MSDHQNKLNYVDAIRGIAILMVILVHTSQRLPNLTPLVSSVAKYGQMGVQLFFVASAYTLCISFEKRSHEPYNILSFYLRRWFRIAPLYYLAILIYFFVAMQFYYASGQIAMIEPYSITNVIANLTFIHGFVPSANNNVVPGGWSIGTEMAFYVVFPLLFSFSKKLSEKHITYLFGFLMLCLAANLTLQTIFTGITHSTIQNNDFRYFNIVNQLPVFILGIIAYFLHSQKTLHPILSSKVISIIGFLFFTAAALLLWKVKAQLLPAIMPTLSGVSFLFLLNWLKFANLQSHFLSKIGVVSYSMYIFHFLFAWILLPYLLRKVPHVFSQDMELFLAFILVSTLTYSLALVTQRFIEKK